MLTHHARGALGALALAAILLASCGGAAPPGQAGAPGSAAARAPAQASASGVVTVRLGYFPNVTHAAALIGVARGFFADALGPGVALDTKTFNAGPALIEAMFAGELDIAYIGPNPAINGFVKSNGDALRIVAGAASGGAAFIVRPAAGISGPADLGGKKIATPQLGNTQDVALRYYLKENGLETVEKGGTVQVIPTQNPDILRLFQQGAIDGAWVPEPWAARLVLEADGAVLVDERDRWPEGKFVTTNIIVRRAFLDEHRDLVTQFLVGHLQAVGFATSAPNEVGAIVNGEIERITGASLPEAALDKALGTLEITYDPLPATLYTSAEHAFALGFLGKEEPDLSQIYDLGPLNEALAASGQPSVQLP